LHRAQPRHAQGVAVLLEACVDRCGFHTRPSLCCMEHWALRVCCAQPIFGRMVCDRCCRLRSDASHRPHAFWATDGEGLHHLR
jgi:hypothetical protein